MRKGVKHVNQGVRRGWLGTLGRAFKETLTGAGGFLLLGLACAVGWSVLFISWVPDLDLSGMVPTLGVVASGIVLASGAYWFKRLMSGVWVADEELYKKGKELRKLALTARVRVLGLHGTSLEEKAEQAVELCNSALWALEAASVQKSKGAEVDLGEIEETQEILTKVVEELREEAKQVWQARDREKRAESVVNVKEEIYRGSEQDLRLKLEKFKNERDNELLEAQLLKLGRAELKELLEKHGLQEPA